MTAIAQSALASIVGTTPAEALAALVGTLLGTALVSREILRLHRAGHLWETQATRVLPDKAMHPEIHRRLERRSD
jgi:hypothetical protein